MATTRVVLRTKRWVCVQSSRPSRRLRQMAMTAIKWFLPEARLVHSGPNLRPRNSDRTLLHEKDRKLDHTLGPSRPQFRATSPPPQGCSSFPSDFTTLSRSSDPSPAQDLFQQQVKQVLSKRTTLTNLWHPTALAATESARCTCTPT